MLATKRCVCWRVKRLSSVLCVLCVCVYCVCNVCVFSSASSVGEEDAEEFSPSQQEGAAEEPGDEDGEVT